MCYNSPSWQLLSRHPENIPFAVGVVAAFRGSLLRVYMEISVDGKVLKPLMPTGEASLECEGSVERELERLRRW